jgi:lipopolysaccharide transport system ATP-binding protein
MKVIQVENLSKTYDLGLVGTGTLSKDLNRTWARLRGKPDPYATLAELNDRTQKTESGTVYALKDINFCVEQGEVLGIIGKNGAGKSTLLKILSQITSPSSGDIKIKGRVASLLEVGTGMHPEMTARQNIYLNGSIMGMRRHEITQKLDEIVDFAGIGKYIDTPIKRFSSGMQVRLGFAVAAFLEPEILIVDEVLAVGDAEFQKKAVGKMKDVSKNEGRTVLFVSHNMAAVKSLCSNGILIENGKIVFENDINSCVSQYLLNKNHSVKLKEKDFSFLNIRVLSITIRNKDTFKEDQLFENDEIEIYTEVYVEDIKNDYHHLTFQIFDENGVGLISVSNYVHHKLNLKTGNNKISCFFNSNFFTEGTYFLNFYYDINHKAVYSKKEIFIFKIESGRKELGEYTGVNATYFNPLVDWKID